MALNPWWAPYVKPGFMHIHCVACLLSFRLRIYKSLPSLNEISLGSYLNGRQMFSLLSFGVFLLSRVGMIISMPLPSRNVKKFEWLTG